MRTALEEEEELAPSDPRQDDRGQDRELTISSTTLLAIFFGLVLICGLFFGLGYTLGRRASSEAGQLPSTAAGDLQPAVGVSKPSAASQPAAIAAPAATDPQTADASAGPAADTETASESTQANTPETAANPAPAPAAAAPPAVASSGIMVQIAAISNPADADALVSALQKHGYSVSARRFPADPLIHVQVGPFSNRADAIAMRQKLLGDGYNAILK